VGTWTTASTIARNDSVEEDLFRFIDEIVAD
jgi:hypothetical protein